MGKLKQAALSGEICQVCMKKIDPPADGPTLCQDCGDEEQARQDNSKLG